MDSDRFEFEIRERFQVNLLRAQSLVAFYKFHSEKKGGPEDGGGDFEARSDLLRAAVMLLHASLEDLVRSLAEWKLPTATAESLKEIPLAAPGLPRGKERFTLVDLAEFRGQSVDEVVARSVGAYLDRSSFNHPGEIAELLAKIGVPYRIEKPVRDALAAMMSRRHAIAHRADGNASGGPARSESRGVRPIEVEAVKGWINAVIDFGTGLLDHVRSHRTP